MSMSKEDLDARRQELDRIDRRLVETLRDRLNEVAAIAQEHHPVVELADLLDEFLYGGGHVESELNDIHRATNLYGAGFWFFGVNFRLQSLQ